MTAYTVTSPSWTTSTSSAVMLPPYATPSLIICLVSLVKYVTPSPEALLASEDVDSKFLLNTLDSIYSFICPARY
jgi:hypothetical protein